MYKKLMLGLALMTNLNLLPAVQRLVPRVALSVRTLATRAAADEVEADRRLYDAVLCNDKERVVRALRDGANVNAVNEFGETPLHRLAFWGNAETAQLLLGRSDTNVNAVANNGDTPLHKSAYGYCVKTVRLLLERSDINVNAANLRGDTPLHKAAFWGNAAIVRELLKRSDIKIAVRELSLIRVNKGVLGADLVALAESKASR